MEKEILKQGQVNRKEPTLQQVIKDYEESIKLCNRLIKQRIKDKLYYDALNAREELMEKQRKLKFLKSLLPKPKNRKPTSRKQNKSVYKKYGSLSSVIAAAKTKKVNLPKKKKKLTVAHDVAPLRGPYGFWE